MTRWPALTLLGIALAVLIGITHTALQAALDCILATDDIHLQPLDPYGPDGYGP